MYSPSLKSYIIFTLCPPLQSSSSELSDMLSPRLQSSFCPQIKLTHNSHIVHLFSELNMLTELNLRHCQPLMAGKNKPSLLGEELETIQEGQSKDLHKGYTWKQLRVRCLTHTGMKKEQVGQSRSCFGEAVLDNIALSMVGVFFEHMSGWSHNRSHSQIVTSTLKNTKSPRKTDRKLSSPKNSKAPSSPWLLMERYCISRGIISLATS